MCRDQKVSLLPYSPIGGGMLSGKYQSDPWPEGARTNYEAKYELEGRVIRRLVATLDRSVDEPASHPLGVQEVLV